MPGRFPECLFWQRPGEGTFCLQKVVMLFRSVSYPNADSNRMHVVRDQAETSTRTLNCCVYGNNSIVKSVRVHKLLGL